MHDKNARISWPQEVSKTTPLARPLPSILPREHTHHFWEPLSESFGCCKPCFEKEKHCTPQASGNVDRTSESVNECLNDGAKCQEKLVSIIHFFGHCFCLETLSNARLRWYHFSLSSLQNCRHSKFAIHGYQKHGTVFLLWGRLGLRTHPPRTGVKIPKIRKRGFGVKKNSHFPVPKKRAFWVKKSPFLCRAPQGKWGFFDSERPFLGHWEMGVFDPETVFPDFGDCDPC